MKPLYNKDFYKDYMVSTEELNDMILRYFNGEKELRDNVIVGNIPLVRHVVFNKFQYVTKDSVDDLISVGTVGLIKAVDSYDITRGYTFSTYASRVIYNEIAMELRKDLKRPKNTLSLDMRLNEIGGDENNDGVLSDIIEDTNSESLEDYVERKLIFEQARSLTSNMKRLVRDVLWNRYFVDDRKNQYEIASELGISQPYTAKLQKRGINKLKEAIGV